MKLSNNAITSDSEEELVCAQKREITNIEYNFAYDLIDVTPYDGCSKIENSSFNEKAIFMRFDSSPKCPLQEMLNNLESNRPSLAIIGFTGKLVRFLSYIELFLLFIFSTQKVANMTKKTFKASPIFMPMVYANKIRV